MYESYSIYPEEQLEDVKQISKDIYSASAKISEERDILFLNALKRQQSTLQDILDTMQRVEIILMELLYERIT